MSAFPQIVWRPSTKDVVTEFAPRAFFLRVVQSSAALVVVAPTPAGWIPVDQVLIVRHVFAQLDPGAGQVLQNGTINILQEGTAVCQLAQWSGPAPIVAANASGLSWQGELVLTNTETISAAGTFDALGVANVTALSIGGYMVPRGNWQR